MPRVSAAWRAAVAASPLGAWGFIYRPRVGLTWDPSCMTWNSTTYCYFMYTCGAGMPGCGAVNATHYGHGLVAVSGDGVHFRDHSAFNAEYRGVSWFKCMVHKFVMDHGTSGHVGGPDDPATELPGDRGCPDGTSQCLRFLRSTDALRWEYMYTLHPDTRWYASKTEGRKEVSTGRWDHAYMQEDLTRGGYVAFPQSDLFAPVLPAPGLLRSGDGVNWAVDEPVVTDFTTAGVTPTSFEIGGVERMPNGRYYMIARVLRILCPMWTLRSAAGDVTGPYAPDPDAYRLSGQGGWEAAGKPAAFGQALAAWSRNYDTYPAAGSALISQYMVMPHTPDCGAQRSLSGEGHVWLLPFRLPAVDAGGHLRLAHWEGNEALKGARIA
eukprot:gene1297-5648_t